MENLVQVEDGEHLLNDDYLSEKIMPKIQEIEDISLFDNLAFKLARRDLNLIEKNRNTRNDEDFTEEFFHLVTIYTEEFNNHELNRLKIVSSPLKSTKKSKHNEI